MLCFIIHGHSKRRYRRLTLRAFPASNRIKFRDTCPGPVMTTASRDLLHDPSAVSAEDILPRTFKTYIYATLPKGTLNCRASPWFFGMNKVRLLVWGCICALTSVWRRVESFDFIAIWYGYTYSNSTLLLLTCEWVQQRRNAECLIKSCGIYICSRVCTEPNETRKV